MTVNTLGPSDEVVEAADGAAVERVVTDAAALVGVPTVDSKVKVKLAVLME